MNPEILPAFKESLQNFINNNEIFISYLQTEASKNLPDARKVFAVCQSMYNESAQLATSANLVMNMALRSIFDEDAAAEAPVPENVDVRRTYICSRTGSKIVFVDGDPANDGARLFKEGWTFREEGGWQVEEQE